MIEQVLKNFKSVKIDHKPFSHKVINQIFPKEFYKNLINNLPEKNDYVPINKTGRVSSNYPPERFIFELNNETINKLDSEKKSIFNELLNMFTNPQFFNVISNDFKDVINKRIKGFSEKEKQLFGTNNFQFRIGSSLVKDITKYKLGVHTDTPSKFLTFLFYIPKNDHNSDLGTALYEPLDKNFHLNNEVEKHYSIEDFNLVKKIKFLPNTLFIFPRTNESFHGVQTINTKGIERNLLLLNYYFQEKG